MLIETLGAARDLGRLNEIAGVLIRHGFGDTVRRLGLADASTAIAADAVKARLRANTEQALAAGVYGVPTLALDGELFWGNDATELFTDWLADRSLFRRGEYARLANLPVGVQRPR